MKDNFSGFQNATAPPIVCGCGHRAGPRSALLHACPGWALNTGGEAPDPSHGEICTAAAPAAHSLPQQKECDPWRACRADIHFTSQAAPSNATYFASVPWGERISQKWGFFPKCNQCPWWWLFIPVCSIKACEEIPYKKHACMNKYHSEMRRSTKKKIQTNFVFPYGGFLAMTTNNKNYIWGHDILLFLFFVKVL